MGRIRVRYSTVDGVNKLRYFKTLAGARAFASKWVGDRPEIGRGIFEPYAVSSDGVGKIEATISLYELFPLLREVERG